MGTILVIVVIAIVIAMSSSSKRNGGDSNVQRTENGFFVGVNKIKMHSPVAQRVFDWYYKVMISDKKTAYEALRDVNMRREMNQIRKIQNSLPDNEDMTYIDALDMAFTDSIAKTTSTPNGFILNPMEECYFHTKSSELKTIQRLASNVTYSGFRFTNGNFRMGNMMYYPTNVEGLKHYDDGDLLVTNQRIIFKGGLHTKSISLGSIIGIEKFDNDGVIIFLSDRSTPIVINFLANNQFFYNKIHDIAFFHNDLNYFCWAVENVLYQRLVPKDVQEAREEADSLNFTIARKTMLAEGFEQESKI